MSIQYTVRSCDNAELTQVDRDGFEDDISDYADQLDLQPRGGRPQNHTVLVKVCNKLPNNTQTINTDEVQLVCHYRKVAVMSLGGGKPDNSSEGEIPKDILEGMDREKSTVAQNETETGETRGSRQRRQAEGIEGEAVENRTAEIKFEDLSEKLQEKNVTNGDPEESNEILPNNDSLLNEKVSPVEEEMDQNLSNHVQSERERLAADMLDVENHYSADYNSSSIDLSLEYDDYGQEVSLLLLSCVLLYAGY